MRDIEAAVHECSGLAAAGADHEQVIDRLRALGFSKVESIGIIARALGVGLAEAKALVHTSTAWEDVRERDEEFHGSIDPAIAAIMPDR